MSIRLSIPMCLFHVALSVCLIAVATPTAAQYNSPSQTDCKCGPSALPAYSPPYPQPAVRPLDGSQRSGVTYREGTGFRGARTNLGTSAYEHASGPGLWSGVYLGLHGGYGFGKTSARAAAFGAADTNGGFGGVHLGHNWQFGAGVLGVEGDVSKNWAEGQRRFAPGYDLTASRDWTGSMRARAGYAVGNVLAFATAGVAFAGHTVSATSAGTTWRGSNSYVGYVYGGGVEWQVMPQVSLRGEVLRYEFSERDMRIGAAQAPVKLDETVVRGGLSYRFN
jgi:outer membrane immunogenic protein